MFCSNRPACLSLVVTQSKVRVWDSSMAWWVYGLECSQELQRTLMHLCHLCIHRWCWWSSTRGDCVGGQGASEPDNRITLVGIVAV